jgi:hypothetical protein
MYVTPLQENPVDKGEAALCSCPCTTSKRLMEGEKIKMFALVMSALGSWGWTARRFTPQHMLPVIHNWHKKAVRTFSGMLVTYQPTLQICVIGCSEMSLWICHYSLRNNREERSSLTIERCFGVVSPYVFPWRWRQCTISKLQCQTARYNYAHSCNMK